VPKVDSLFLLGAVSEECSVLTISALGFPTLGFPTLSVPLLGDFEFDGSTLGNSSLGSSSLGFSAPFLVSIRSPHPPYEKACGDK